MNPADSHREIAAADAALDAGRYRIASRHIAEAVRWGGASPETARLRDRLNNFVEQQSREAGRGVWSGLAAGVVSYLLLGTQEPPEWTMPVWALCAFVLLPGLIGFVIGRKQSLDDFPKARFRQGFLVTAPVMFCYASIAMIAARNRIGSASDVGQEMLAGTLAAAVFAALAGCVAGAVCALPAWRIQRLEQK